MTDDEVDAWEEKAASFEAALSSRGGRWLDLLAEQLGVPAGALARFHVGWRCPDHRKVGEGLVVGRCWTIPERDGRGRITAINRRYEDGDKRVMYGGRRGLYVADGWRDMPGPVYCPEGFSDAAALVAVGTCAVGRPNVGAGVDVLAELLRDDARPVVVLGENDENGPRRAARVLPARPRRRRRDLHPAAALRRRDVTAMMPPRATRTSGVPLREGGLA
ncbi:MAG: hypothetical protein WKF75_17475 [Singulisphaera sp.]